MGKIQITSEIFDLSNGKKVVNVALDGAMDLATVADCERRFNRFLNQGFTLFTLDATRLEYINSTGMGYLVKLTDQLAEKSGKLKIINLSNKVQALFQMLGLEALLDTYPDRASAIDSFLHDAVKAPPPVALKQKPATAVKRAPGAESTAHGDESAPRQYPLLINCQSCDAPMEIPAPGKYRCPKCASYLESKSDSDVQFFPSVGLRFCELKIPMRPQILQGMRTIIANMAANESEAPHYDRAAHAALAFAQHLAQAQPDSGLLHVLIVADKDEIRVAFRFKHTAIKNLENAKANSANLQRAAAMVGQIELLDLPGGGQIIFLLEPLAAQAA